MQDVCDLLKLLWALLSLRYVGIRPYAESNVKSLTLEKLRKRRATECAAGHR
jgi:hypothetical protein